MSTYLELDKQLQGRCRESRKLANNTYLKRRWHGTIAVLLHNTDVLTFHPNGKIEVNTGGYDTVTTRDRVNNYLPKPWKVYGERGATVLSNFRWYSDRNNNWKRTGTTEVLVDHSAVIYPDGKVTGGDIEAYRQSIRDEDNRVNRLRSKLRRYVAAAREHRCPARLTSEKTQAEENAQIRSAMIMAFGFDRYIVESKATVLDELREYKLVEIKLDNWNSMKAITMTCPSTNAPYVLACDPRCTTVPEALDEMFGIDGYLEKIGQEA